MARLHACVNDALVRAEGRGTGDDGVGESVCRKMVGLPRSKDNDGVKMRRK